MKHVMLLTSCLLLTSTFLFANDPNREFSIANDPNGVWSYGFTPTLGGSFSLADAKQVNLAGANYQQGSDTWVSTSQADCDNGLGGGIARTEAQQYGSVTFPWDTLYMHPGCHGEYWVLRWTAPLSGTYHCGVVFGELRRLAVAHRQMSTSVGIP